MLQPMEYIMGQFSYLVKKQSSNSSRTHASLHASFQVLLPDRSLEGGSLIANQFII